jgi:hypothetical protein
MSIEDLKADIDRNTEDFANVAFASFDDVKEYVKTTLLPLVSNVVDEVAQIDDDVADMINQSADVLQPETAGIFAAVITQCKGLAEALQRRLKKGDVNDDKWAKRLPKIRQVCEVAQNTLLEITVMPTDEGDDDALPDAHAPQNTNAAELDGGADVG